MRYEPPVLRPDPNRAAFFDGMGEERARLTFACTTCGAACDTHLLSFVTDAHAWFRGLDDSDRQRIVRLFGCPLGEFAGKAVVRAHDEEAPYFGTVDCPACDRRHLLYLSFGEVQPARYCARLHGVAPVVDSDAAEDAATNEGVAPALSLAVPLASGRVLLRFRDGDWRLTRALFEGRPRRFGAGALGIAWDVRAGLAVDALVAASESLSTSTQESPSWRHEWLLGCRDFPAGTRFSAHCECGFVLRPWAPAPFVLYETIGGGMGGGSEAALTLSQLRAFDSWRVLLEESGCAWAIGAIADAADDDAAMQAVVIAAVDSSGPLHDPFPRAPSSVSEHSADRERKIATEGAVKSALSPQAGWFAAPDEPPLYYVSSASTSRALVDDLAIVVERMNSRREADDALDADTLLFQSDGAQFKLYVYWYEPDTGCSAGGWRYTLVLRHLQETLDASDFEGLCEEAVGVYARERPPVGLDVFFRYEYGGEVLAKER